MNTSALYENERAIMASNWRQAGFDVQEAVLPAAQTQDNQARASFPGMYSFRLPRDGIELIADEEKRAGRLRLLLGGSSTQPRASEGGSR